MIDLMQKLIFFTVILLFGCAGNIFSQNKEWDELLDTCSLPGARELLQKESGQIDAILKISSVRFAFGTATDKEKEEYEYEPYEMKSPDSIRALYSSYFSNIELKQKIVMPEGSLLEMKIHYKTGGVLEKYGETPVLTVQKIFFKDGTLMNIDANREENEDDEEALSNILDPHNSFELYETKPIDSILVAVHYEYPASVTKVYLDGGNTSYSGNDGSIELKSIDGGNISLLASNALFSKIDIVQALNKEGKALRKKTSSSFTAPSANDLELFSQYNEILKSLIGNIDAGQYENTVQFKKELLRQIGELPKPDSLNQEQMTEASYSFRGNIAGMNFFFKSPDRINIDTTIMLKNGLYGDRQKSGWFVARDIESKKIGFIDASGKWVIEPAFRDINKENDYICLSYEKPANVSADAKYFAYDNIYYWLDKTNKKMVRLDFQYAGELNDSLCRIQRETNGSYGILNYRTNEIVLPMRFGWMQHENGLIAVREGEYTYGGDGKYGGYTIEGKEVIPLKYKSVSTDGNYFYTDLGDWEDPAKDVFDRNGQKINPENTSVIGRFVDGQPLLVQDSKSEKNFYSGGEEKKSYIDTLGNIIIDASKYIEAEQFSNGMAIVCNTAGKYGYINTKGEEVIPCQYKEAFSFQKNYGFVEKEEKDSKGRYVFCFIDRENNIVKTIHSPYYRESVRAELNGNNARYYFNAPGGGRQGL